MDVVSDGEERRRPIRGGAATREDLTHADEVRREAYGADAGAGELTPSEGEKAMTASLQRAIQRDPNPNGRWKGATLSNDGTSLVTDRDGHTYILTIREV